MSPHIQKLGETSRVRADEPELVVEKEKKITGSFLLPLQVSTLVGHSTCTLAAVSSG